MYSLYIKTETQINKAHRNTPTCKGKVKEEAVRAKLNYRYNQIHYYFDDVRESEESNVGKNNRENKRGARLQSMVIMGSRCARKHHGNKQ